MTYKEWQEKKNIIFELAGHDYGKLALNQTVVKLIGPFPAPSIAVNGEPNIGVIEPYREEGQEFYGVAFLQNNGVGFRFSIYNARAAADAMNAVANWSEMQNVLHRAS